MVKNTFVAEVPFKKVFNRYSEVFQKYHVMPLDIVSKIARA